MVSAPSQLPLPNSSRAVLWKRGLIRTSKATVSSKFQAFIFSAQTALEPKPLCKYVTQRELFLPSQLQWQDLQWILFSPKAVQQIWTSSERTSLSTRLNPETKFKSPKPRPLNPLRMNTTAQDFFNIVLERDRE